MLPWNAYLGIGHARNCEAHPVQAHEGIEQLKLNLKKEHDLKVDYMTAVWINVSSSPCAKPNANAQNTLHWRHPIRMFIRHSYPAPALHTLLAGPNRSLFTTHLNSSTLPLVILQPFGVEQRRLYRKDISRRTQCICSPFLQIEGT